MYSPSPAARAKRPAVESDVAGMGHVFLAETANRMIPATIGKWQNV